MTKWLVGVIACAACSSSGGGPSAGDFLGTYSTTQRSAASNPGSTVSCTDTGTAIADPSPYFEILVDPFFQDPSQLTLEECPDTTDDNCVDQMVPLAPSDDGLEAEEYNSAYSGDICSLYYSRATATLDGSTVTVLVIDKDVIPPGVDEADCTLDMAKALADTDDCSAVDLWVGTKL
ncbi:MAG TPA: hypothetical protein VGM88_31920 [Kofleriaceae bacterium]|jgi:hypothetical protein